MKYLKRFNEERELEPRAYRNAAHKLQKLGHVDRAKKLQDWSKEVEGKKNLIRWEKNIEEFSSFGTFKISINKQVMGDFYLDIGFDDASFIDNYECEKESNPDKIETSIWLPIGIIPTNKETLGKCKKILKEFDNGFFWAMSVTIKMTIESGKVNLTHFNIEDYDSDGMTLSDRQSAGKFKNLLKSIFSKPNLNYPGGRTDGLSMYKALERTICIESGFSSEYGFSLEDVGAFINTISPNSMYTTI